jgi:hypothetical protein
VGGKMFPISNFELVLFFTVEMNIQDYFEKEYPIIEKKLKTFSDNEIVNGKIYNSN